MGAIITFIGVGGVFAVIAALAFAGLWRSWASVVPGHVMIGAGWMGIALVALGIGATQFDGPLLILARVLMVVFAGAGVFRVVLLLVPMRWALPW